MKVLVVDDDSLYVEFLTLNLKNQFGHDSYGIWFRGDEKELMGRVAGVDLLLMDIVMPGIWGTFLTKKIRSAGLDIPIVLMTGNNNLEFAISAMKSGADDLLFKPIGDINLNLSVESVFRSILQKEPQRRYKINYPDLDSQDISYVHNSGFSGRKIERYNTGGLLAELNYKDGKLDGVSKVYRKLGILLFEGSFKNGLIDGSNMCFDANGQVYIKDSYKEGTQVERYIYFNKQQIIY